MGDYNYGIWVPDCYYGKGMVPPIRDFKSPVFQEWSVADIAKLTVTDITNDYTDRTRIYAPALAIHQYISDVDIKRLGINKCSTSSNWHYASNDDKYLKLKKSGAFRQFICVDNDGNDLTKFIDKEVRNDALEPKKQKIIPDNEKVHPDNLYITGIMNVRNKPHMGLGKHSTWADYSQFNTQYSYVWGFAIIEHKYPTINRNDTQVVKVRIKLDDLAFIDKDSTVRASTVDIIEIICDRK